jgi:hypothetical protein
MGFTGIRRVVLLASVVAAFLAVVAHAAYFPVSFNENYASTTNAEHTQVLNGGEVVNLVLDQSSGNKFWSILHSQNVAGTTTQMA